MPLHGLFVHRPSRASRRTRHERRDVRQELFTVGKPVPPIYGIEKATGTLRFPADVNLPNMLWMKILRSPHAHAKILDVDAVAAQKLPGVVAILMHNDVPRVLSGPYQHEIYLLDEHVRVVGANDRKSPR